MKLIFTCLMITAFFSCRNGIDARTERAVKWVNSHPKPIVVTSTKYSLAGDYYCLFKDSAGIVFYAGDVKGFQPDTIK